MTVHNGRDEKEGRKSGAVWVWAPPFSTYRQLGLNKVADVRAGGLHDLPLVGGEAWRCRSVDEKSRVKGSDPHASF